MNKSKKIDKRLVILLTEKQHEQLRIAAFNLHRPIGEIVRGLVDSYLDSYWKKGDWKAKV